MVGNVVLGSVYVNTHHRAVNVGRRVKQRARQHSRCCDVCNGVHGNGNRAVILGAWARGQAIGNFLLDSQRQRRHKAAMLDKFHQQRRGNIIRNICHHTERLVVAQSLDVGHFVTHDVTDFHTYVGAVGKRYGKYRFKVAVDFEGNHLARMTAQRAGKSACACADFHHCAAVNACVRADVVK